MAKRKIDPETRKAIRNARNMIKTLAKQDGNEAETRRRVERIFESLMGYDALEHITREYAVRGAGETEHCDFVIQLSRDDKAKPEIMVELKRVNIDLAPKHLRQAASYAINAGCEWILLTNSKEWRLYHVTFAQPPQTKLVHSWNLLEDDVADLAEKFEIVNYKNVKKGNLDILWQKTNVLKPRSVLTAILSEESIRLLRRKLRRSAGVPVSPEDVVGAIRRLLNEASGAEMEHIKITLPGTKRRELRPKKTVVEEPNTPKPTDETRHEDADEKADQTKLDG